MSVPVLFLSLLQVIHGSGASNDSLRGATQDASLSFSDRSKAYQQLLQKYPSDISLYSEYASLLIANRAYEPALTWIRKGIARAPSDTTLRLRKAIALNAVGKSEASLTILKSLPATAESRLYMGFASRALGDHESARKYLSEAWDSGVRDPYTLYSLIEEDHALADKTAGLRHYQTFLTHFPDSAWLHVLYANAYAQKNQDAEARKEYQEALRIKADLPGVNFRLGYLMYRDNQHRSAAECFRKELDLNPYYSDANLFLGQTLRNLGQEDEAVGYFRKAIALDPASDLAYRAVIGILTDKGDLGGAAGILKKAEEQFPTDPGFPAQLARILTKLNREEEALKEQEKFRLLQESRRGKPVGKKQ
ncbi:MAG TPA: tetratricopeptide repeat protein [Bryobacteraceae bacterium]|nr:tetratricopeptide repeat protein [Bryobacteraceae bacterium]